jgi:hypothetical protein
MGGRAGGRAGERARMANVRKRLEMSPISKHPNFKNLWQPQLFKCSFRIA